MGIWECLSCLHGTWSISVSGWEMQNNRPMNGWVLGELERSTGLGDLGFPGGSDNKEFTCNVGDLGLIPDLGRSPGGRQGKPLQYSCLENPHRQRSLAGFSPGSRKDLDTTERLSTAQQYIIKLLLIFYIPTAAKLL